MRKVELLSAAALIASAAAGHPALAALTPGSGNVAVIEPKVLVPNETPCSVALVTDATFGNNYSGSEHVDYTYSPPAACPGPWARVVLVVKVEVQKGIQYDRTGTLWMNGVPLWFGTTAEPTPNLQPTWRFERDLTEYSSLFTASHAGFEVIYNEKVKSLGLNSLIKSNATLLFYPPTAAFPARKTPDLVLPLSAPGGGTVSLNTPTDTLATTVTLPTNVKAANLELYTQGQAGDEFWYTCVPAAYTSELQSCGGGAVREGEVTVDGAPAGVAPVYPWIFTGGIDPYLWAPIPGVQTLSFTPFTVPLSPFAGPLSNGMPHTIAVSVYGDNGSFSAAGALLVTLDPTTPTVTGSVTLNDLAAAPRVLTNPHINSGASGTNGTISTRATHKFTITGEVMTSSGKVTDTVKQTTAFDNHQRFDITTAKYVQDIVQSTTTSVDETSVGNGLSTEVRQSYLYPLTLDIKVAYAPQGSFTQLASVKQGRQTSRTVLQSGVPKNQSSSVQTVNSTDTLLFNSSGQLTGNENQAEIAGLLTEGADRRCFGRTLKAQANLLTSVTNGCNK